MHTLSAHLQNLQSIFHIVSKSHPLLQNSQTYAKSSHTAKINPTQIFHPTPVFSAIRNMRFIVPRNLTRVLSKESFMVSAREEEERISSPMEMVSCISHARTISD